MAVTVYTGNATTATLGTVVQAIIDDNSLTRETLGDITVNGRFRNDKWIIVG